MILLKFATHLGWIQFKYGDQGSYEFLGRITQDGKVPDMEILDPAAAAKKVRDILHSEGLEELNFYLEDVILAVKQDTIKDRYIARTFDHLTLDVSPLLSLTKDELIALVTIAVDETDPLNLYPVAEEVCKGLSNHLRPIP